MHFWVINVGYINIKAWFLLSKYLEDAIAIFIFVVSAFKVLILLSMLTLMNIMEFVYINDTSNF